jgi:uncharacterized HAD superfamily protein
LAKHLTPTPIDVYVDLDDVLAETSRMFLSLLHREFGRQREYCELTTFSLSQSLSLSPGDFEEFVRLAHTRRELMSIEPVDGAKAVLDEWRSRGIRISVVTGRPPENYEVSCEWLSENAIPYDRLLMVDKYRRSSGKQPYLLSLQELHAMPFSLAIEDCLEVATYLAEKTGIALVALRNCPWNSQAVDHPRVRRCTSWREISRLLDAGGGHEPR